MRLGAYDAVLKPGSKIADIYGEPTISERHRHRYEVNINYSGAIEGRGPEDDRATCPRMASCPRSSSGRDHPWFIGVQFHPELKSRPFAPQSTVRQLHRRGGGAEPAGVGPPVAPKSLLNSIFAASQLGAADFAAFSPHSP
ncbi:MAG: hypothetical protein WDM92_14700 [Caulobacteraceae bacterium]